MNRTIKQKQSTAIDKQFYWLQDRVKQGEFRVCWAPGKDNLVDYYTKYHSPTTHRRLRPVYTYIEGKSPTTLQGCVEILTRTDRLKPLPLLKENNPNSKTSQATLFNNISDTRLYKLTHALKQRLMNRLV